MYGTCCIDRWGPSVACVAEARRVFASRELRSQTQVSVAQFTGPTDVAKHAATGRSTSTIIRQTTKQRSPLRSYVERGHQAETTVRTMKDVIEDKARKELSATEHIIEWMIKHAAFLHTCFLKWKDVQTLIKRQQPEDQTSQLFPT